MTDTTKAAADHVLGVSDRDLWLIRTALQAYLATFSHTEGYLIEEVKTLLEQLPDTNTTNGGVNEVFPDQSSELTL